MIWNPNITGYTMKKRKGFTVFEIDTAIALYKGIPWRSLGRFGKRKYENLLYINHSAEFPKFIYL